MALEKMGPEFGCVGSRNAGKGKAFAHSVAVEFLQFFKLQEERFKFRANPLSVRAKCDGGEAWDNDDPWNFRRSPWTKNVPWRQEVDQGAKCSQLPARAHPGFSTLRHQVSLLTMSDVPSLRGTEQDSRPSETVGSIKDALEKPSASCGSRRLRPRKAPSAPQIQLLITIPSQLSTRFPATARPFWCACLLRKKSPQRGH